VRHRLLGRRARVRARRVFGQQSRAGRRGVRAALAPARALLLVAAEPRRAPQPHEPRPGGGDARPRARQHERLGRRVQVTRPARRRAVHRPEPRRRVFAGLAHLPAHRRFGRAGARRHEPLQPQRRRL
jgi:hypothetical protein